MLWNAQSCPQLCCWWRKTDMDVFQHQTFLLVWLQVKHIDSKSGSQCSSTRNTPQAAATDSYVGAAMLCRVLSHSGECLWLSLEESSQGWREAGRGWCRCGRGWAGLQGLQAFIFLSHLWRGGKGGETHEQGAAGALAGLWRRFRNQRCNVTKSPCCLAPEGRHRDTEINNVMSDSNTLKWWSNEYTWLLRLRCKTLIFRLLLNQTSTFYITFSLVKC